MTWGRMAAIVAGLAVGACVSTPKPAARPVTVTPPLPAMGLERVMGRNAAQLSQMFGQPDLDLRERVGRRLQFTSAVCVLDAYLYPPRAGGEAVVTYLDARLPDGTDIDRASCVAALTRGR